MIIINPGTPAVAQALPEPAPIPVRRVTFNGVTVSGETVKQVIIVLNGSTDGIDFRLLNGIVKLNFRMGLTNADDGGIRLILEVTSSFLGTPNLSYTTEALRALEALGITEIQVGVQLYKVANLLSPN